MRRVLLLLVGVCFVSFFLDLKKGYSQDLSVYNQFYFNPFLYNPAFVGSNGGTEVNTVFRQQWLGIDDAPISGTLTLQHASAGNVRLGLTVTHESVVILQRNSALITAGYRLPLGYEQSLTFGISAGIGRYGLDLSQVDRSDPALSNSLSSTLYADGNFGFMYQLKALKLGFAVNNIFDANPYSQENFSNLKFSNLESMVGSVSYRFQFENNPIAFEPYLLYRSSGPDFRQAEAAGVFYYQDNIWVGGAYRYESNPALFVGFNLFQNLKVSYAFEFPPTELNNVRGGSHELMFSYNFGRKKKAEVISEARNEEKLKAETTEKSNDLENLANKEQDRRVEEEKEIEEVRQKTEALAQRQKADSINTINTKPEPEIETPENMHPPQDSALADIPDKKIEENNITNIIKEIDGVPVLSKGYYVVTGVFNYKGNAEKFIAESADKGFQFKLAINPDNSFYYVYKLNTDNLLEARYSKDIYAKIKQFSDVWIYKVE